MSFVALHAWHPGIAMERFLTAADRIFDREGLEMVRHGRSGTERHYGSGSRSAVLFFDADAHPPQLWAYISAESFVALGEDAVTRIFLGLSKESMPAVARSLDESGLGIVRREELEDRLAFVDWFQYYSPAVVARWGLEALKRAPFHRVEPLPSGACALWLTGSPMGALSGRQSAADALGITLRPLVGRNPKSGDPLVIPWS